MIRPDDNSVHICSVELPPGLEAPSMYTAGTFFVHLSGSGARQVKEDAIMTALVAHQLIPVDLSTYPNIGWYKEESKPFTRVLVVEEGLDRLSPALDGIRFTLALTAPNQPSGKTVDVEVVYSGSTINTFRVEYVPYTVDAAAVAEMVSSFCEYESVKRDKSRLDIFWIRTRTPLEKIPHWILVKNLIKNEVNRKRLVCTVKDRDIECFYCRDTTHWSNKCDIKRQRDNEERVQINIERKQARMAAARAREAEEQEEIRRLHQDKRTRPPWHHASHSQDARQLDQTSGRQPSPQPLHPSSNSAAQQSDANKSPAHHQHDQEADTPRSQPSPAGTTPHARTPSDGSPAPSGTPATSDTNRWRTQRGKGSNRYAPIRRNLINDAANTSKSFYADLSPETPGGFEANALISSISPQYSPFASLSDDATEDCWKEDFLDALSPKLFGQETMTDWECLHRKSETDEETILHKVQQLREEVAAQRKKSGLQKMKRHNDAQNENARRMRENRARQKNEETQVLEEAFQIAQIEKERIRSEEEKQKGKDLKEDQERKQGVTRTTRSKTVNLRSVSLEREATSMIKPPPFLTPNPCPPAKSVHRLRATRTPLSQAPVFGSEVDDASKAEPTQRSSRSTSSTPQKNTKGDGDGSLLDFFSSNPESELSQIESYLEQPGLNTSISNTKRQFDHSAPTSEAKKVKIANSSDEFEWDDMKLTAGDYLASDPPVIVNSVSPELTEPTPSDELHASDDSSEVIPSTAKQHP